MLASKRPCPCERSERRRPESFHCPLRTERQHRVFSGVVSIGQPPPAARRQEAALQLQKKRYRLRQSLHRDWHGAASEAPQLSETATSTNDDKNNGSLARLQFSEERTGIAVASFESSKGLQW